MKNIGGGCFVVFVVGKRTCGLASSPSEASTTTPGIGRLESSLAIAAAAFSAVIARVLFHSSLGMTNFHIIVVTTATLATLFGGLSSSIFNTCIFLLVAVAGVATFLFLGRFGIDGCRSPTGGGCHRSVIITAAATRLLFPLGLGRLFLLVTSTTLFQLSHRGGGGSSD